MEDLRRQAQRHDGLLESVELCLVADSIALFWSRTAPLGQRALHDRATGPLDNARPLKSREIHLKDFLRERSGGYAPPRPATWSH